MKREQWMNTAAQHAAMLFRTTLPGAEPAMIIHQLNSRIALHRGPALKNCFERGIDPHAAGAILAQCYVRIYNRMKDYENA